MARPKPESRRQRAAARPAWAGRVAWRATLWLLPAAALWLLATPLYNRLLIRTAEVVLHVAESPDQSHLYQRETHNLMITRGDYRGGQAVAGEFRVSDSHFNWILLIALFLAVPDVPWRARLRRLGLAAAILAVFHLVLVVFHVEFFYATQLGDWSAAHYGPLARNVLGLGKHLLDLPFKFGLPLLLWAAFHLRPLLRSA